MSLSIRLTVIMLAAGVLGCHGTPDVALSAHGFVGTELAKPLPKPPFQFIDSHAVPYRLDSATAGKVTLLLFGYTNCPDICPVHLSNLAAVLDRMPDSIQAQVAVVFVTTDPARDTPAVLDTWVKGFDPHFVGLTASDSIITASQQMLQVLQAVKGAADAKGSYPVGHAAGVIAFTRDGLGRVEYPPGTRQRDWAHDLPLLVSFGTR
jgi:protein SCO1/2